MVARLVLGPLLRHIGPTDARIRLAPGSEEDAAVSHDATSAGAPPASARPTGSEFALDRARPAGYEVHYLPDELEGKTYHEPSGNGEERDPSGR